MIALRVLDVVDVDFRSPIISTSVTLRLLGVVLVLSSRRLKERLRFFPAKLALFTEKVQPP